jgi:AAA+ ATPase superfamily predicted ATPase
MEAPFKAGGAVEPPYFAGRERDLKVLTHSAKNLSQHYLILAPRRFGKTSLLSNLRRGPSAEPSLLVPYVNCRDMACPEDLYRLIIRSLAGEVERVCKLADLWERFRAVFEERLLRAARAVEEIGGALREWGEVCLRFREREIDEGELIRAAFSFPARVARERRVGVVFFLDEFQEVAEFDGRIFSSLKAAMDRVGNARYFFSGPSLGLIYKVFLQEKPW